MGRRGATGVVMLVGFLLGACGSGPAPDRSPSVRPADLSPAPDLTLPPNGGPISPAPSLGLPEPSAMPPGLSGVLACGNDPLTFSADALRQPPTAEQALEPAAAALRRYVTVEAPPEMRMPLSGWRMVVRSPTSITYVAPTADSWRIVTMAADANGWAFFEGGNCDLQVRLPDGVGFATWRLDPATPPVPEATTIRILGTENACANGRAPVGRVLAPVVLARDDAVTIVVLVRHLPGGADCQGNPEFPQAVELTAPLGDRPLFDGSTVPPTARS